MRIAISGTAGQGKTTVIKDFLLKWPNYKTTSKTYRDALKAGKYPHSKLCNKEGQWAILNHMVDELQKYGKNDNVIFDRCPIDNLVYSMWAMDKESSDIDEDFLDKCIPIVRESMRLLDIIFFTPITKVNKIPIENDGFREIDQEYIEEIDNLFKAIGYQYTHNFNRNPFFPVDDSPGFIEIFGSREQRIALIGQYLDLGGELIEATPTLTDAIESANDPTDPELIKKLIGEQRESLQSEQFYKSIKI